MIQKRWLWWLRPNRAWTCSRTKRGRLELAVDKKEDELNWVTEDSSFQRFSVGNALHLLGTRICLARFQAFLYWRAIFKEWNINRVSQKKQVLFRMLLEPRCTGSITSSQHPCIWKLFFGSFLPRLSGINRSQVIWIGKFGPTALNFASGYFFWKVKDCWKFSRYGRILFAATFFCHFPKEKSYIEK